MYTILLQQYNIEIRMEANTDTREDWKLNEADTGPYQTTSPVPHTCRTALGPIALHSPECVLDVFWPEGSTCFRRLHEQRRGG